MRRFRPAFASALAPALAVAAVALLVVFSTACASTPKPVPSIERGWTQNGVASWYGPDFHGRLTANGEVYDMYGLTAAHKSLPFDTVVEVENLENGRTVHVRINDRGPFVRGRVIDLSYTAAEKIEMIGPGTARVRLRVIGAVELPEGRYTVQVAAFSDPASARALAERLRGYPDVRVRSKGGIHRVLVGTFEKRKKALKMAKRLARAGHQTYVRVDLET